MGCSMRDDAANDASALTPMKDLLCPTAAIV
jgi:hypothetical protein